MDSPTSSLPQRLFRQEVIEAQQASALGPILLVPRATFTGVAVFSAAAAVLIVAFLFFGSYTRRISVTGQLVPASGVIRVQAPQPGVVIEKHVQEGQWVRKGDVLYVLSGDRPAMESRAFQADIARGMEERRKSLALELERNRSVEAGEVAQLERRAATLRSEGEAIARQTEQQQERTRLAEEARARYQGLADKEYIAREQLYQKETELSEQRTRMQGLQRDALGVQRELASTLRDIAATRSRYAAQNAQLERGISSASQELTEAEARRRVVVAAPQAGRATLVAAETGQAVDTARPLLNLVPDGAKLQARLYAASRTVGFVRDGDKVLLRYQSFPYQKFGQYEGVVASISSFAVPSQELVGFALADMPPGEPVYAITVDLQKQSVDAFGNQVPLTAGMRVDADVLQETRRLYEWMLEPLYTVTRKM